MTKEQNKMARKEYKRQRKELKKKQKAQKKLKYKQSRLLYKVKHQSANPNKVLYLLELIGAVIVDTLRWIVRRLVDLVLALVILLLIFSVLIFAVTDKFILPEYYSYVSEVQDILRHSSREDFSIKEGSIIYDADGNVLANLYDTSFLTYLDYEDIPQNVVNAYVAVEDRTFWENDGVDYYGIARVLYRYAITHGNEAHGASTITQQLARTVYLTRDVSIARKIKEIAVARELTNMYSKEDIMEFYVNTCCYSNGIYGIQGAAQSYFGVDAKDLTLAQATYLCAIPNRPSYYNPYEDIERPKERQHKILKDMLECGYITEAEYETAMNEPIELKEQKKVFNDYLSSFAIDCSVRYLMEQGGFKFRYTFVDMDDYAEYKDTYAKEYSNYKDDLYTGGYRVYTTLDSTVYDEMQGYLDETLADYNNSINEETGIYNLQGALTVVDNETQKVIAVVGGRHQESDNTSIYTLNRAYQAYRQPGSSFKPLVVYTPAMERGYTPNSKVHNIDVTEAKKKGANAQKMSGPEMTLRSAVEQSKNGVAWQIFDKISPGAGLSYVSEMQFSHIVPDDYNDSAALGGLTYGVSTVEMAGAYATLANHGEYKPATCLKSIIDKNGNEIFKDYESKPVYTALAADNMVDVCKGVLTVGTAKGLRWNKSTKTEAFGKTGTTNDNKDVWFCGATPYYSISVWVGYDTPTPMKGVYGASYPATIWKNCMLSLIEDKDEAKFEKAEYKDDTEVTGGGSKYLEGRSDDEVLSANYTVGDYRSDRLIGEQVDEIISKMNSLDTKSSNYSSKLTELYSDGQLLVDTIYSQKYTAEMRLKLQTAYENLYGATSEYNNSNNSNAQTGNVVEDVAPTTEQTEQEQVVENTGE